MPAGTSSPELGPSGGDGKLNCSMGLTTREFRGVVLTHEDMLYRLLCRLTRNPADAEDLLQDCLLSLWRKRDRYGGNSSPAAYLRRAAYRTFLNHRQKQKRRAALAAPVAPPDAVEPPDVQAARRDAARFLRARLEEALEELPPEQRDAFLLFRNEGLTAAEIAETMDLPVKTVETRVRRATVQLAGRLERYREHLPTT